MTTGDEDCTIVVDGVTTEAISGQSVVAALQRSGHRALRWNLVTGEPRAAFCGMGVCFECEVQIDGVPNRRACMAHIHPGMQIVTAMKGGAGRDV